MPITFVYRCPYDNPDGKYVRRFENETILDWFQQHWKEYDFSDEALPCIATELLGRHVYGFDGLFYDIAEKKIPKPTSNRRLGKSLRFSEGWNTYHKHVLDVRTNDDEWDLAFHFIADELLAAHPDKLTYMVREEPLPLEVKAAAKRKANSKNACTYMYVQAPDHGGDQQYWDTLVVPGVRLDDFAATAKAFSKLDHPEAMSVQEHLQSYAESKCDWQTALESLAKTEMYTRRNGNLSQVRCAEHLCQLHHHAGTCGNATYPKQEFHQVLVFDDIWARSHPNLASSIDFHAAFPNLAPLAKAKRKPSK